jgi:hypothetical protein
MDDARGGIARIGHFFRRMGARFGLGGGKAPGAPAE